MNIQSHYKDWNINIEQEPEFWKKYILDTFIIIPETYPYCKHGHIGLKNTQKINSPLEGKCNYYKCCRISISEKILSFQQIQKLQYQYYIKL